MAKYIQKRRRRWYATLDIPKDLRSHFGGKPRFVESLKTESQTEAERRCPLLIIRWKAEIEAARTGDTAPLQHLREAALDWRDLFDTTPHGEQRDAYAMILQDKAEAAEQERQGAGKALYKLATRQWLETSENVEDWLTTLENEPKTIDMKRSDLKRFAGRFKLTKSVQRKHVQRWVHDLQNEDGLKLATVRRIVSAARGYWDYLQRLDVVRDDVDPFHKVVPNRKRSSKSTAADKRQTFSASAVVALLFAAVEQGDRDLGFLIWLGMWTGCRIEELCALRVSDVSGDRFTVSDAKSEAGLREVPIHSQLLPAIRYLCDSSSDGFVLSGLTFNKYQDRSNAVGKRFGRLKTKMGFDKTHVYHSLRKTVATQLDAAGIPETVSARIVGHDLKTMTYGLYSGGVPFETKRQALEALSYPLPDNSHAELWKGAE
ncbi:tyrosine-type recombinase/integrase [Palleronia sp. LCG004]|uniref:tyrosine-type recombinase/integrase n=1 Tax=Palleronia sp. LCG004 TaxID=3079304 RepID=UPI00294215BC|nr:tyrosine-type recombinase/integrase [Palleronia sp. LCG004]WOI55585.1 tyrosine-type recombinase/integrase [Palleronia sp. LCG004]